MLKPNGFQCLHLPNMFLLNIKVLLSRWVNDLTKNVVAKSNYELLCDYEIVLGLTCMLMLEAMLTKLVKGRNTFVCDLVTFIIIYTINLKKRYDHPYFQTFNDLANNSCDVLHMVQYLGWQTQVQYASTIVSLSCIRDMLLLDVPLW